jgi:uncharacterized protein (TIGR03083 family)
VTRAELLGRLERERAALVAELDRLTPEQFVEPGAIGAWSIKDLLAHLIAHEQQALQEVQSALRGEQLTIDHNAIDAFNDRAVTDSRSHSADEVRSAWEASFREVMATVGELPDAAFDPLGPVVAVLGDSIDGALGNNTYLHYAEHRQELDAWRRGFAS